MYNSIVEYVYKHAQSTPEKLCIIDESQEVTYGDYWNMILKIRQVLLNYGVTYRDCIVVEADQTVIYLALELAIQLCSAIFVPLEKNCAKKRICDIAIETNAAMIITAHLISYECKNITYAQLEEKILSVETHNYPEYFPKLQDTAEILFSTGTTGKPKGIELTHQNNIALAENVKFGVEMQADNIELIPVPLNHSHGLRRYYGNMYNGSTVIVLNGVLNITQFFQFIEKYHVTAIDLVPASLGIILRLSKGKLADYKNQLEYIQLGSAPLPENDKIMLCELLPHTRLYNFYGSTESGCTCILDFNKNKGMRNCIGKATHNACFSFVDENHKPINATIENPGLLACHGSMNMKGYWCDSDETRNVLENGIIYSNDLAYCDDDGYIYMLGRKGDVINVGGSKVAPDEIESIVMKYPNILDCACIGIPDKIKGQAPQLFIVTEQKADFDLQKLREYLQMQFEPYKIPKNIEFIDKIPRTFNGKIKRKELQRRYD